jgi:hypothetical protein
MILRRSSALALGVILFFLAPAAKAQTTTWNAPAAGATRDVGVKLGFWFFVRLSSVLRRRPPNAG